MAALGLEVGALLLERLPESERVEHLRERYMLPRLVDYESLVDGICLAPLDSQAMIAVVREAKEAGIPTVIFDSGLDDPNVYISYVATDNGFIFSGKSEAATVTAIMTDTQITITRSTSDWFITQVSSLK